MTKTLDYLLTVKCQWCNSVYHLNIDIADLRAWQNGALAQNAFPYLDASERELLISGTCSTCWNDMFGE